MMPFSGQASFCFDCEYSAQEVWGLGFRNVPESSSGTIRIAYCLALLGFRVTLFRIPFPTGSEETIKKSVIELQISRESLISLSRRCGAEGSLRQICISSRRSLYLILAPYIQLVPGGRFTQLS